MKRKLQQRDRSLAHQRRTAAARKRKPIVIMLPPHIAPKREGLLDEAWDGVLRTIGAR